MDYADIMEHLNKRWRVAERSDLTGEVREKARSAHARTRMLCLTAMTTLLSRFWMTLLCSRFYHQYGTSPLLLASKTADKT